VKANVGQGGDPWVGPHAEDVEPFTGLPVGLPAGQHPMDRYISNLVNILGKDKAAAYLGIPPEDR
jgi:hypothetical protein